MGNKQANQIEDQACRLNDCIQILHYVYEELEEQELPEDRQPGSDDIYARVPALLYRVYEDMKGVREELYKILEDVR